MHLFITVLQNTAKFQKSKSQRTRHALNYQIFQISRQYLQWSKFLLVIYFIAPTPLEYLLHLLPQHHQGLLCFLVFTVEEADEVRDKGSGDTTTVDADTLGGLFEHVPWISLFTDKAFLGKSKTYSPGITLLKCPVIRISKLMGIGLK